MIRAGYRRVRVAAAAAAAAAAGGGGGAEGSKEVSAMCGFLSKEGR